MASIEKRTTGKGTAYRVKIRIRGYAPQSATFERLTDAKRWAQQTETAIHEGRYFKTAEAKRHTLAEMVDRFIDHELPRIPKSAKNIKTQLQWWSKQLGHHTLADITPAMIVKCRDELIRNGTPSQSIIAPATVNRYLVALSMAFSRAVKEWHWLEDNPVSKVKKLKEPRGRVRYLDDDERERLLTECGPHPDLYLAVVLALSTGARRTEIMSLRWKQVDLKRGFITLEDTKNGERRALPLTGHALALVQDRAKIRRLDTDLLFPSRRVGAQRFINLRAPFDQAVKRAGIDDFKFHDLRHSAASYLAMNGASLAEIAEVLGHKTLQMVKRYSHLSEGHVSKVVERMNSAIFGTDMVI